MHPERIYLDYNATSPLSHSVVDWLRSGDLLFANPSSQHSLGKASRKVINEARSEIFSTFHKSEKEHQLFFHSGATEAFTTIAHAMAEATRATGPGLLICTSPTDHPCVSRLPQKNLGPHVSFLEIKKDSFLRPLHQENIRAIQAARAQSPELRILYHHLWVHNETGLVSPLTDLHELKKIPHLFIHVDAVQSVGKVAQWRDLPYGDYWTYSGHKFGALKGLGFTLMKQDLPFFPLLVGGGQQKNLRPGTENPLGAKALTLALREMREVSVSEVSQLRQELVSFLSEELEGLGSCLENPEGASNSNTIYFYLHKLTSDLAVALFDLQGIELSAGSACSSGASQPSEILLHMGLSQVARNGLRLSFSYNLNSSDLQKIQSQTKKVFAKLRSTTL